MGKDLIWAAQNRAVVKQMHSIEQAYHAFRVKYNCIPGDCKNSMALFGLSNGNGDKRIDWSTESQRAWQTMIESGMLPDERVFPGGVWHHQNFAINPNESTRVMMRYTSSTVADNWVTPGTEPGPTRAGNAVLVGRKSTDTYYRWATLTVERMNAIDKSLDDGHPKSGRLQALNGYHDFDQTTLGSCVDNGNNVYLFTETVDNCNIVYFLD